MTFEEQREKAVAVMPQEFRVTEFKSLQTSDGLAFRAIVTYRGVEAGTIENTGTGGPDNMRLLPGEARDAWRATVALIEGEGVSQPEEAACDALLTREGF